MKSNLCLCVVAALFAAAALAGCSKNHHSGLEAAGPVAAGKPCTMDRIKALEGTWISGDEDKDGQPDITCVYKVTSGGSAVAETLFPGQPHEMITMYHMHGGQVVMTHYCAMGNQPRLVASGDCMTGPIHFVYVDGTNIAKRDDAHMDSLIMTPGADGQSLVNDWSSWQDGKVTGHKVMNLQRKRSW